VRRCLSLRSAFTPTKSGASAVIFSSLPHDFGIVLEVGKSQTLYRQWATLGYKIEVTYSNDCFGSQPW
jgi:hypothetical protein